MFTVNPKSVTLAELFGQIDQNTMEWNDGLLAGAIRSFSKEKGMRQSVVENSVGERDLSSRCVSTASKSSIDHETNVLG